MPLYTLFQFKGYLGSKVMSIFILQAFEILEVLLQEITFTFIILQNSEYVHLFGLHFVPFWHWNFLKRPFHSNFMTKTRYQAFEMLEGNGPL